MIGGGGGKEDWKIKDERGGKKGKWLEVWKRRDLEEEKGRG